MSLFTNDMFKDDTILALVRSISSNLIRAQRESRKYKKDSALENKYLILASMDSYCLASLLLKQGNYKISSRYFLSAGHSFKFIHNFKRAMLSYDKAAMVGLPEYLDDAKSGFSSSARQIKMEPLYEKELTRISKSIEGRVNQQEQNQNRLSLMELVELFVTLKDASGRLSCLAKLKDYMHSRRAIPLEEDNLKIFLNYIVPLVLRKDLAENLKDAGIEIEYLFPDYGTLASPIELCISFNMNNNNISLDNILLQKYVEPRTESLLIYIYEMYVNKVMCRKIQKIRYENIIQELFYLDKNSKNLPED